MFAEKKLAYKRAKNAVDEFEKKLKEYKDRMDLKKEHEAEKNKGR